MSGDAVMAAKYNAEPHHASRVETLLHGHGVEHVRARKYGATVIVESGPKDDPVTHFRLRRDGVHLWCLDMAGRGGRWERTPFRDNIDSLVTAVVDNFPWALTDIA
jgi:hypothetical protein